MTAELKPCPFCGANAVTNDGTELGLGRECVRAYVRCIHCGATISCGYDSIARTIAAWNKRVGEETKG